MEASGARSMPEARGKQSRPSRLFTMTPCQEYGTVIRSWPPVLPDDARHQTINAGQGRQVAIKVPFQRGVVRFLVGAGQPAWPGRIA